MGRDIHLTIGGDVLKPKNANCERRVKPIHWMFYTGIKDTPETQLPAGISLVVKGTQCR